MRDDDIAEAAAMGQTNLRAQELLKNHCRNGRLELPNGTSPLGEMLGLPIGMIQVRCPHAPRSSSMSSHGLDLAVAFYKDNCIGCDQRSPTGIFPTISQEADARDRAAAERIQVSAGRDAERLARWGDRHRRRVLAVAVESYVTRDLAADLEALDPHPEQPHEDDPARRSRLLEVAQRAPEMLTPLLVDCIKEIAENLSDPTACAMVGLLARAGQVTPQQAIAVGSAALSRRPSREAGQLVALFASTANPTQVKQASLGAIVLCVDDDDVFLGSRHPEPAALHALASADLVSVTEAVLDELASDDEWSRDRAADAARTLLMADPSRVTALGAGLVAAIRGEDQHYAGYPTPSSKATRALAEAWRGEPDLTRHLVEGAAAGRDEGSLNELGHIVWHLERWDDDSPASAEAQLVGIDFSLARLSNDWGPDVAFQAAQDLENVCRTSPELASERADAVLGALILACETGSNASDPAAPSGLLLPGRTRESSQLQALERLAQSQHLAAVRREVAKAFGHLVRRSPDALFPQVLQLMSRADPTNLDELLTQTCLRSLTAAVTSETVAHCLPVLYTALLGADARSRALAVELWVACARRARTMPSDLIALADTILRDEHTVVHRAMLANLARLGLPDEALPALAEVVAAWARTYETDVSGADVVEHALDAMLWIAGRLNDERTSALAAVLVTKHSGVLTSSRRARLLLRDELASRRATPSWAAAALEVLAARDRVGHSGRRGDTLLQALLQTPVGMKDVPFEAFAAIARPRLPGSVGPASEPVSLLQSAGRWADAAELARASIDVVPDDVENRYRKSYLASVAAAALAEASAVSRGLPEVKIVSPETLPLGIPQDGPAFVDVARARYDARTALSRLPVPAPATAAQTCHQGAQTMSRVALSGRDTWVASCFDLASTVLRCDEALRAGSPEAQGLLAAARRQGQVLVQQIAETVSDNPHGQDATDVLAVAVIAAAESFSFNALDELLAHVRDLPHRLPIYTNSLRRRHLPPATDDGAEQDEGRTAREHRDEQVVCVLSVDGDPVTDVLVASDGHTYDVAVDLRFSQWPSWADRCKVDLLSVHPPDALTVPSLTFVRADVIADETGARLQGVGTLSSVIRRAAGAPPLDLPVHIRFAGDGRNVTVKPAGVQRLAVRPFDPTRDLLVGRQVDPKLHQLFAVLQEDRTLDHANLEAFSRFYTALVRAASRINFDQGFRAGKQVTEAYFHNRLEELLLQDPTLRGRLSRRDPIAGGFDDLMHDGIVAELKVEKRTPRSVEDCAKWVGQPAQYGAGVGSRLSILVVLDHSRKKSPHALPENLMGWLQPAVHGVSPAPYPSRVGVLIIQTHWKLPSSYSRAKVDIESVFLPGDESAD
jgi:hypothetical protein